MWNFLSAPTLDLAGRTSQLNVNPQDGDDQFQAAVGGDREALASLCDAHSLRLKRMVEVKLGPQMRARVNGSDILQDVFVEAQRRIGELTPRTPFFLWLRSLTEQRLTQIWRYHVGAAKRSTRREWNPTRTNVSSASLASLFVDGLTTVSQAALRQELRNHLEELLEQLPIVDREIISLRHFEQLSNEEAAIVLDMKPTTTSSRYVRALKKLRSRLEENPLLSNYFTDFL